VRLVRVLPQIHAEVVQPEVRHHRLQLPFAEHIARHPLLENLRAHHPFRSRNKLARNLLVLRRHSLNQQHLLLRLQRSLERHHLVRLHLHQPLHTLLCRQRQHRLHLFRRRLGPGIPSELVRWGGSQFLHPRLALLVQIQRLGRHLSIRQQLISLRRVPVRSAIHVRRSAAGHSHTRLHTRIRVPHPYRRLYRRDGWGRLSVGLPQRIQPSHLLPARCLRIRLRSRIRILRLRISSHHHRLLLILLLRLSRLRPVQRLFLHLILFLVELIARIRIQRMLHPSARNRKIAPVRHPDHLLRRKALHQLILRELQRRVLLHPLLKRGVVNLLRLQLLQKPRLRAHLLDFLNLARPRPERKPVQYMQHPLLLGQRSHTLRPLRRLGSFRSPRLGVPHPCRRSRNGWALRKRRLRNCHQPAQQTRQRGLSRLTHPPTPRNHESCSPHSSLNWGCPAQTRPSPLSC